MFNKLFRELDSSYRISIPEDLIILAQIKKRNKIYLCQFRDECIVIKGEDNIKDQKIIGVSSLDEKGRFIFPCYLRNKDALQIEIFVLNGELILKEGDWIISFFFLLENEILIYSRKY